MSQPRSPRRALRLEPLEFRRVLSGWSGGGEGAGVAAASVVGRHLFYNNSAWDGNDPAAAASDDAAIAVDKSALLPGQTASFAHYTSYSRGINGVMVDVAGLGGTPDADDFAFKVGNNNAPGAWAPLATAPTVLVRPGAGADGSTRIHLVWPEGTIKKQWLQVTVLSGPDTGLAADDVFYFGNAIGETGNSTANAVVNAGDEIGARVNSRNPLNPAPIDFPYDFNRDKLVNASDQIVARVNSTNPLTALSLISAPVLQVQKTADVTTVLLEGDVVNYRYLVTNPGSVPLSGVTVSDSAGLAPARQADEVGDNDDLLESGEAWVFAASYTVTAADVAVGQDLASTATADSDQTDPASGSATVWLVSIHPINHASFVMTWNGLAIYVDPVGGAAPYAGLPLADLVLVTHSHSDHFSSSTIAAVDNTPLRIVAPLAVYNGLSAAQRAVTTVLPNGQRISVLGMQIDAVPAYNANHPQGSGNGYVITIGERRIYISGDTGDVPEIRALEDIDLALVCMNVPYTMTVNQAASVVREIRPRAVIPYHYRNADGTYADLAAFSNQVGTDLGIAVLLYDWY